MKSFIPAWASFLQRECSLQTWFFSTLFTFYAELLEACSLWGTVGENEVSVPVTRLRGGCVPGPQLRLQTSKVQSVQGPRQAQRLWQLHSCRRLRNKIFHSCVPPEQRTSVTTAHVCLSPFWSTGKMLCTLPKPNKTSLLHPFSLTPCCHCQ